MENNVICDRCGKKIMNFDDISYYSTGLYHTNCAKKIREDRK